MAIEPIKGFYVHDEVTDTDGVAKVSIEAVQEFEDDIRDETSKWLDDNPEATTTVLPDSLTTDKYKDESVTLAKIKKGDLGYVTPEMFGAVGDGTTDDTAAIEATITEAYNKQLPVIGNGVYKITGITLNQPNINAYFNEIHASSDGLTVKSELNNIYIKKLTSSNGDGLKVSGSYNTIVIEEIHANDNGVTFESDGGPVIHNNIKVDIVYGQKSIFLTYKNTEPTHEYVNENQLSVYAMHSPVGIHIDGASNSRCNDNVFNNPNLELCTTAGIIIDGSTIGNKFLNCRNNEIGHDKTLVQINGALYSSVIDCKMPVYPDNIKAGDGSSDTRGAPGIIRPGIQTPSGTNMWIGEIAFCTKAGGIPCVFPIGKKTNSTLYLGTTTELNPRTMPNVCRAEALIIGGTKELNLSNDYGYLTGELPGFILNANDQLKVTQNGNTLATITNTGSATVLKKLHFVSDTVVYVI